MQPLKDALEEHTIVVEDPVLRKGFTSVPNLLFCLKGLSHGARLTFVLLLKYAWQEKSCFPGVDTLASDLEVERKSVIRYTKELEEYGLVAIRRRGLGKTNVYYINRLRGEDALRLKSHGWDGKKSHLWGIQTSRRRDSKNTQKKKTQKKNTQR